MAQAEIYISYAWRDREQMPAPDDREHLVNEFCETARAQHYTVHRDKDALTYRDSIEAFMRDIGAGRYVLAVVSDKYLRSEYCMFEAVRMLAHERFEERVFPVVLPDAEVFDDLKALIYKQWWRERAEAFGKKLDEAGRDSGSAEWLLKERIYKEIHEHVGEFITRIVKRNVLSPEQHLAQGFAQIFAALEKQVAADALSAAQSAGATGSHPLSSLAGPEPVFHKLDLSGYRFEHALRPAQTKSVVAKLPASLNLIGERGQGRHRFMEDLEACGIADSVGIVRIKLGTYLNNYDAFLQEIARQGKAQPTASDLVALLRQCAVQQNRPILFILENPDELYADKPGMDTRFDMGFLQKLNSLKNADFATLLLSSYSSVKELTFRGQSSPLWLEVVSLNPLSADNIQSEIKRRLPDLPASLSGFITEQLEFDPYQTHELLKNLLDSLEGRSNPSRDFVGQELRRLRERLRG